MTTANVPSPRFTFSRYLQHQFAGGVVQGRGRVRRRAAHPAVRPRPGRSATRCLFPAGKLAQASRADRLPRSAPVPALSPGFDRFLGDIGHQPPATFSRAVRLGIQVLKNSKTKPTCSAGKGQGLVIQSRQMLVQGSRYLSGGQGARSSPPQDIYRRRFLRSPRAPAGRTKLAGIKGPSSTLFEACTVTSPMVSDLGDSMKVKDRRSRMCLSFL